MSVLPENESELKSVQEIAKGPFDWRIVLLAIYLFALLLVSINWIAGLMMANTTGLDDEGKKITACRGNPGSPCGVGSPTPSPITGTNTNTASPTPAATVTSNQPDNVGATNANRPANNTNANTNVGAPRGNSNANPPPITSVSPNPTVTPPPPPNIADVVVIKNHGLFGWEILSACRFCENGCLSGDGFLFLIVLFAGMLGAVARSLIYLGWHTGKGKFSITWAWYYLFQPFYGATLAVIFYVVIRGGFGSGPVGKNNLYSFAAVAFLAGLFTENVMAKLKLIAESLLVSTERPTPQKPTIPPAGPGASGSEAVTSPPAGDSSVTGTAPRNIGRDEPPV